MALVLLSDWCPEAVSALHTLLLCERHTCDLLGDVLAEGSRTVLCNTLGKRRRV